MELRLTKKNSIIFTVIILVLCGSLGYLVWRVNQEETTAPTGSEAAQRCDPPCGSKPDLANWARKPYNQSMKNISDSSREDQSKGYSIPSKVTIPAGLKGEVILYYSSLDGNTLASFELNGKAFNISSLDGNKRAVVNTGIRTTGGETITVNSRVLNGSEDFASGCPGSRDNKYWSLGWIAPNSEKKCGTTFNGPPTGGQCTPFVPVDVSGHISWVTSTGNTIVSQQCWGDWMEWVGDYDFNDYFLIVAVKQDPYCGDGTVNNGEECDPPSGSCTKNGQTGKCSSTCECEISPYCGDGIINQDVEQCEPPGSACKTCPPGSVCLGSNTTDLKETDGTCSSTCKCISNLSCGNGKLDAGEECESGNPTGVQCQWSSCNTESCTCLLPSIIGLSKGVSKRCIDEGAENPKVELTYIITVKDMGRGELIRSVEDILDPKVVSKGLVPTDITYDGVYSNGKIVWDFSVIAIDFARDPSSTMDLQLSYKLMVDKDNFGVYTNTATLTTTEGNVFHANATINADCLATVPQTGIFDSTIGRVIGGFSLILLGGFVYSIPNGVFLLNHHTNGRDDKRRNRYRVKFEGRIFRR